MPVAAGHGRQRLARAAAYGAAVLIGLGIVLIPAGGSQHPPMTRAAAERPEKSNIAKPRWTDSGGQATPDYPHGE
jgi:hypothetical protein